MLLLVFWKLAILFRGRNLEYIPLGATTSFTGYPSNGKSLVACASPAANPVGSAAQEPGWQPAVTRVPIRETPVDNPLTPESVPGPDTSGKGNLLSPLARRGDPRAAAELQRRGRSVLFVPDTSSPDYLDASRFADILKNLQ